VIALRYTAGLALQAGRPIAVVCCGLGRSLVRDEGVKI
jgi:hypothetical protein